LKRSSHSLFEKVSTVMHKCIVLAFLALTLMLNCAGLLTVSAAPEEVDVVVNKSNNITALSGEEVRRIFVGEKSSWPGGKRITVLMLAADQPERLVILREVFKMNESDYTKYFLQAAFTGRVQAAPRDLPSVAQMKAHLAANSNAIGYLKKEDVDDSVKVLLRLP
jgi:ABC-type phosphate transport system substrate-binding protein